jgi:PAS domain-containing protein
MAELNLSQATTTNFTGGVPDYIVNSKTLDAITPNQEESYWYFADATKNYGYYFNIAEIYNAANALCTWAFSRGYTTENQELQVQLDHVRGAGNSSFNKIIWQHGVVKLIVGDAFIEFKRDEKTRKIINMIPVSPERVRVVFTKSGLIKRYDIWNGSKWMPVQKENMLHSSNKQIADQQHGTSQVEAAKFIVDALNEALQDERIIKHRDKALGIAYYETDKSGKIAYANSQIEKAVKNGEMVGLPKDTVKIEAYPSRSSEDRTGWISYLENRFYQIFGVPRSIASSDGTSEVGGKMGHVIFEPIYTKEQLDLEDDLWNQQQIRIKFNRPPSLQGMQPELDESKNTGQIAIQPNDTTVSMERE